MVETKQQLIERIRQERAGWEALLAEIGEAQMTQPGAIGEWSFKDTIAHLISWWQWEMARLEAARYGEGPPYDPPDQEVQVINNWTYTLNKYRPLPLILHEAETAWQQLEEIVQHLPEQDLTEPGRFEWLGGESLVSGVLNGFFNHLHEEHEPLIRAWLNKF
jgi:hypothetical protein